MQFHGTTVSKTLEKVSELDEPKPLGIGTSHYELSVKDARTVSKRGELNNAAIVAEKTQARSVNLQFRKTLAPMQLQDLEIRVTYPSTVQEFG